MKRAHLAYAIPAYARMNVFLFFFNYFVHYSFTSIKDASELADCIIPLAKLPYHISLPCSRSSIFCDPVYCPREITYNKFIMCIQTGGTIIINMSLALVIQYITNTNYQQCNFSFLNLRKIFPILSYPFLLIPYPFFFAFSSS